MKKRYTALLLALVLLLCGCGKGPGDGAQTAETEDAVSATVPADGNTGDVTCKGSYTAEVDGKAVIASVGDAELTNDELQAWYWAEVAAYRQEEHDIAPDFSQTLDTQVCGIDDSVGSWQQYFLREALNAWHGVQALLVQSEEVPMPTEEAYQPNLKNYETYLTDIPATKYLYGYNAYYQLNTLHEEYLEALPETLEELAAEKGYSGASELASAAFGTSEDALNSFADTYNRAYMYFTELSYDIEPTEEELAAFCEETVSSNTNGETYVDIRHILLTPEGTAEEDWAACEEEAQELLEYWQKKVKGTEAAFAELANKNSEDTATALDGGAYHNIRKGQLMDKLDAWCFDSQRLAGDTTIIRSDMGIHILYFSGSRDAAYAEAEADYYRQAQAAIVTEACEAYPMEVEYSAITLGTAEGTVCAEEVLYPDVAHERYPEIPLFLQQDYPATMYGGFPIRTNGCGITSYSMLASYMTDDEQTPPEMCDRYGRYSHHNGTDGMLFNNEPQVMGFYLQEKTYDPKLAKAALEEGHVVISIQHKGYWTSGGHYIVLESINEDGMVQVRDSNIYNYGKLAGHKEDLHTWGSITSAGSGFWIFEYKITSIPACTRCGDGESGILTGDYICHKCNTALLRRTTYLAND